MISTFPVIHSLVCTEALTDEIASAYAISPPVICQLLKPGSNDTYLVTTPNNRYISRIYRHRLRSQSDVAFELELLVHLASKGVSVSLPIPGKDGRLMRPLPSPEGTRQLVLFTYVNGKPLSWREERHHYLAGQAIARIHCASDDFSSRHPRFRYDLATLTDSPLAAIRRVLPDRREELCYLEGLAGRLRARAEAAASAGLDWGICHGDLEVKNILIDDDASLTVLDFDHCGLGWRVYDFIPSYWTATEKTRSDIWNAFLRGYTETRPIAAGDLDAVPLFLALRRLWALGTYSEIADEWGTVRIGESLDSWLTFFRKWEAEHPDNMSSSVVATVPVNANLASARATPAALARPVTGRASASATFPVAHSILSAPALLDTITAAYAIDSPATCRLVMPGVNDTYLLTTRDARYILRIYRAMWRSSSEIAYELELLAHLAAKGVPVSLPVPARDGTLMRSLPAPEGTRHLVLFTYAPGKPMWWDKQEQCYLAGRLAAMIHLASDDFTSPHSRFCLDLEYLVDAPLAAVRPFLANRPHDWTYLERVGDKLRVRAAAAIDAGLDWGVCHGDFHSENIHIDDGAACIFDFDYCGLGWRAYDIFEAQRRDLLPNQHAVWDTFLKGYTEIRPFSPADIAAVPVFRAIRCLWGIGQSASKVARRGLCRIKDEYLDRKIGDLRKWEAEDPQGR